MEWPSSKNLQITNAGEGVEKTEASCAIGGNVDWCSHYEKQYGVSLRFESRITIWSSNSTSGYLSKENKNIDSKRYMNPIFSAGQFTVAKIWKPPKYPLMDEWMK